MCNKPLLTNTGLNERITSVLGNAGRYRLSTGAIVSQIQRHHSVGRKRVVEALNTRAEEGTVTKEVMHSAVFWRLKE